MVGEIGESHHAIRMMGEYTTRRERLHMAYSLRDAGRPAFPPAHFRGQIEEFFAGGAGRLAVLGVLEPRRDRAT